MTVLQCLRYAEISLQLARLKRLAGRDGLPDLERAAAAVAAADALSRLAELNDAGR